VNIRILIVDDDESVRSEFQKLLEGEPGLEIIGEASNGQEAIKAAQKFLPDVILMDVAMPVMNGIEATRQIVDECLGIKIIAVSMHSSKGYVKGMLSAGASGYILKDQVSVALTPAIRSVASGQVYLSGHLAEWLDLK